MINWGTKWGVYSCELEWKKTPCRTLDWEILRDFLPNKKPTYWSVRYQSAWSPTTKIILKLSSLFPTFAFMLSAEDEGVAFTIRQTIAAGKLLLEESGERNSTLQRRIHRDVS
jgi:hypothetical protein